MFFALVIFYFIEVISGWMNYSHRLLPWQFFEWSVLVGSHRRLVNLPLFSRQKFSAVLRARRQQTHHGTTSACALFFKWLWWLILFHGSVGKKKSQNIQQESRAVPWVFHYLFYLFRLSANRVLWLRLQFVSSTQIYRLRLDLREDERQSRI